MSLQRRIVIVVAFVMALAALLAVFAGSVYQQQRIPRMAEQFADALAGQVSNLLAVTDSIMGERVRNSMRLLMERGRSKGAATLGEPVQVGGRSARDLLLGGEPQANRFQLVDGVTAIMGGTATLFSRNGDQFVRIATNVTRADGERAVGTVLDPTGAAIAKIRRGEAYYGQVDILGNPFLTGYEPIRDLSGEVIGIWYVGYSADLQVLAEVVSNARIMERGFVALLDGRGNVRMHSQHVAPERVAAILAGEEADWVVRRTEFAPWSYQIVTAYSTAEVNALVARTSLYIALSLAAIGVAIGLVLVLALRRLTGRILLLHQVAERIRRDKNLAIRTEVRGQDEIGQLGMAFDELVASILAAFQQVHASSRQLAVAADSMAAIAARASESVRNQQQETNQVATAMHQMAATVQEVAANAAGAAEAAQRADAEADHGARVVGEAIESIGVLSKELQEASAVIAALEGDSAEIGKVIEVIRGIAEQTNLLALNAAIEAARAGEQGRGFAVVAEEVRTLANQVQQSASEIHDMVSRIQGRTHQAVAAMQESLHSAERSVQQAALAGDSLASITRAVDSINELNSLIARAAEEQSAVAEEINHNIANISSAADYSAANADETSAQSRELARLAKQLQDLAGQFRLA